MVGGRVIGIARNREDTLVHVREVQSTSECSIRVIERRQDNQEPVTIRLDDQIWWQSQSAYWTPEHADLDVGKCGLTWDIALPRIGYSH